MDQRLRERKYKQDREQELGLAPEVVAGAAPVEQPSSESEEGEGEDRDDGSDALSNELAAMLRDARKADA